MLAVETTPWIIAVGSLGSALVALGSKTGSSVLVFISCSDTGRDLQEISDRIVTRRFENGETAAFVRLIQQAHRRRRRRQRDLWERQARPQ